MNDFESKLNRLIAAAVVNQSFRQTLLTNPANALIGYRNERFAFTRTEREQILSIHATAGMPGRLTLEEFADQVLELTNQESESATK